MRHVINELLISLTTDGGGKTEQGLEHRLPKYRKTNSQDEQGEGAEGDDGYGDELFERRGRRRERLYKGTFQPHYETTVSSEMIARA